MSKGRPPASPVSTLVCMSPNGTGTETRVTFGWVAENPLTMFSQTSLVVQVSSHHTCSVAVLAVDAAWAAGAGVGVTAGAGVAWGAVAGVGAVAAVGLALGPGAAGPCGCATDAAAL